MLRTRFLSYLLLLVVTVHVAALDQRTMSTGSHLLRWDGRDDRGTRIAQGVYFYELSAAGQRHTRTMLFLR